MQNEVVPVQIRAIIPTTAGAAIFLGNEEKVFAIQVEHAMGAIIGMFIQKTPKERPLTHDLMNSVFRAFGITVERVVITELKHSTYYARLILQQKNELGRKIVELDARPSDSIALAVAHGKPIYVTRSLFDEVEDMSKELAASQNQDEDDDEEEENPLF
ncbi:MAG: bifunctional nuclease family protein [Verrucomicrobia bacterium]|nr:bifunctional nuclease family protein [Verrucomicrobiota bacterium]